MLNSNIGTLGLVKLWCHLNLNLILCLFTEISLIRPAVQTLIALNLFNLMDLMWDEQWTASLHTVYQILARYSTFCLFVLYSLKSCHSPETTAEMWPGAGEWGSQGRIFCAHVLICECFQKPRRINWLNIIIMINLLMMPILVSCCTCSKAAQQVDTSIRALHCTGQDLFCKIFTPDKPGIILATMVIFRQNWSLGYDWLWRGVGTKGEGRGDKLQEVRSSESASKQWGGRTFSILVQSYLQTP